MTVRITAIRQAGGSGHEHIVRLWWTDPATSKAGDNSRFEMVAWIEEKDGKAYVDDGRGHRVSVGVVEASRGPNYLRTYADGVWTDNLLSLPRR